MGYCCEMPYSWGNVKGLTGTCLGKGRICDCLGRKGVCVRKLEHLTGQRGTTMGRGSPAPRLP